MGRARILVFSAACLAGLGLASAAQAGEVYGGVYAHEVDTPLTFATNEGGVDFQLGYRFDPIEGAWKIEPYLIGSLNSESDTSFAGIGVGRKFHIGPIYVRPAVGLVVHDGPSFRIDPDSGRRTDLGSRVLFEPEIAIGTYLSERVSIEASWVHISHAQLLNSEQNPGIDMMGVRLNLKL